MLSKLN
ncbi:hypothetical protein YPPY91_2137, partial [Yersinia pestis PY-91]